MALVLFCLWFQKEVPGPNGGNSQSICSIFTSFIFTFSLGYIICYTIEFTPPEFSVFVGHNLSQTPFALFARR